MAKKAYMHVAYTCGRADGKPGSLFGDVVLRIGDGVNLDNIRDYLVGEIEKVWINGHWNKPTIIGMSVLPEPLALQLAPSLRDKANVTNIAESFNDAIVKYFGRIPEDKDTYEAARHFAMWGIHAAEAVPTKQITLGDLSLEAER